MVWLSGGLTHRLAGAFGPPFTYLARRRADGRTAREARRALKRLIVRRVFRDWSECFATSIEAVAA